MNKKRHGKVLAAGLLGLALSLGATAAPASAANYVGYSFKTVAACKGAMSDLRSQGFTILDACRYQSGGYLLNAVKY